MLVWILPRLFVGLWSVTSFSWDRFISWTPVLAEASYEFGSARPFVRPSIHQFATQDFRNVSSDFSDFLDEVRES